MSPYEVRDFTVGTTLMGIQLIFFKQGKNFLLSLEKFNPFISMTTSSFSTSLGVLWESMKSQKGKFWHEKIDFRAHEDVPFL